MIIKDLSLITPIPYASIEGMVADYILKDEFFDNEFYNKNLDSFLVINYESKHQDFYASSILYNYMQIDCENTNLNVEALQDERFDYSLTLYLSREYLVSLGCLDEGRQIHDIEVTYAGEGSDGGMSGTTDIYYSSNTETITAQELNEAFALYEEK